MTARSSEKPVPCQWFALCENDATTTRRGPIGDGKFGPVPICDRCNDRIERLEKGP